MESHRAAWCAVRGALQDQSSNRGSNVHRRWTRGRPPAAAPGLEHATTRAQLVCLPHYLGDGDLAHEIVCTWSALSDACHQHAHELAPTAAELEHHLDAVRRLVHRLERAKEMGVR
jgi:hypothetical protein